MSNIRIVTIDYDRLFEILDVCEIRSPSDLSEVCGIGFTTAKKVFARSQKISWQTMCRLCRGTQSEPDEFIRVKQVREYNGRK